MMKADLHIHTTASDGRYEPLRIVREAIEAGLSYIAITDHDSTDGHLAIRQAGFNSEKLSIIPGIELNANFPGYEVHILGYFIDIDNPGLKKQLKFFQESRLKRLTLMIEKINSLGYYIEYNRVIGLAGNAASIGRPHIARALVENGYFKKIGEAFDTVLSIKSPAYVPQYKFTLENITELIKNAGGVSVLAHPGLIGSDDLVTEIIKTSDIAGIEVFHPAHDLAATEKYLALAKKYKLKVTGGSDFHAATGRYPEKLGVVSIPVDLVDQLRTALPKKK